MKNNVFDIKDLKCKYKSSRNTVLSINNLIIKEGDFTFVVGASGVGKSTFLETLGLMTNTIENGDATFSCLGHDFSDIWSRGETVLSDFRKNNFSFIFQNTNLFSNLTMLQNACIRQVLQGETYNGALLQVKPLFKSILRDVFKDEIYDRNIAELSGGQRQRLAFIRAISGNFKILFADEPTGNLDPANAELIMSALKSQLKQDQNVNKTVIVVSHDIVNACKYANRVVLIKKVTDSKDITQGVIDLDCIYEKDNFGNWNNMKVNDPLDSDGLFKKLLLTLKEQASQYEVEGIS